MTASAFVTVIVPVRNEEAHLAGTLRPLLLQNYPVERYEILVVDGQSTDDTCAVVRRLQPEFPQLKLLFNPRRLSSAARNVGVRRARGEFVAVVDGHCELRSLDYLRDLVDVFAGQGVDCVGRPQPLEVTGATPLQQAIALARASRLGHNPGSHIYSARGGLVAPQSVAIAYRRAVFERVGLFDESFDACEDVEFNHRCDAAGLRCYLAPELAVHYRPRDSLAGLAYQMQRYGRGRVRLLFKHPRSFSVKPLVPAVFLAGLASTFLLGLASPLFAAVFCLTVLAYGAAMLFAGFWLSATKGAGELGLLIPVVFMAIHTGAGWGVLAETGPRLCRRLIARVRPLARHLGNP